MTTEKAKIISLKDKYTSEAGLVIVNAQKLADELHHTQVSSVHLLLILLKLPEVEDVFVRSDLPLDQLKAEINSVLSNFPQVEGAESHLSNELLQLLEKSESLVKNKVNVAALLVAVVKETKGSLGSLWSNFDLDLSKIQANLPLLSKVENTMAGIGALINITAQYRSGLLDPVIGREVELRRLVQILGRHYRHHPLLVGESGVGKRSVIHALAAKIEQNNVPASFKSHTVYQLDTGKLVSGTKLRGEVEERLKKIISSLKNEKVILYIHSLEAFLAQQGLMGGMGDLLSSICSHTNIRLVASTTPDGFKRLSDKDAFALKRLTVLNLEPPTQDQAIEILRGIVKRYENHHKVQIGESAIVAAVKLAKRYVQQKALPESAIDLLDEAASRKRMELDGMPADLDRNTHRLNSLLAQLEHLNNSPDQLSAKAVSAIKAEIDSLNTVIDTQNRAWEQTKEANIGKIPLLSEENVALVIEDRTGIPVSKMLEKDTDKFLKLEEKLSGKVIGQDEAVRAVCKAIRRSAAGLRDPKKPIGSFLFLGSSGSGKTLIAKALAELLFDDEEAMIRIDCSELSERHTLSRLLGSPNGYQGSEDGGQLTEAVKRKPYSVLLFDEIEKAHADIFNILLQVLDDGRLSDARGKTFDFSNTIVILTTNIGSKTILETPAEVLNDKDGREALKLELRKQLTDFLRPEFLNRLNDQVVFGPLSKEGLKLVADLEIKALEKLMVDKGVKIELSNTAKEQLVTESWEPAYGARPLKRAILKHIQDPLAEKMLSGKFTDGSKICVNFDKEQFNLLIA